MVAVPDWALYAGYAGLLGVIVGWALAKARSTTTKGEDREQEEPEQRVITLDNVIGLDKALATKFYRSLKKSLASGEVKVTLVSDNCPDGYIAYDIARDSWICVTRDVMAPLGGDLAEDSLEFYDDGGIQQ